MEGRREPVERAYFPIALHPIPIDLDDSEQDLAWLPNPDWRDASRGFRRMRPFRRMVNPATDGDRASTVTP